MEARDRRGDSPSTASRLRMNHKCGDAASDGLRGISAIRRRRLFRAGKKPVPAVNLSRRGRTLRPDVSRDNELNARIFLLLALASVAAPAMAADKALSIADYLRDPRYSDLSLSPDGRFLAAKVPFEGGSMLAVLSRADLKLTTTVKGGPKTFVDEHLWVSPQRVVVRMSVPIDDYSQRAALPELYVVDADGSHRDETWGVVYDTLPERGLVVLGYCTYYCESPSVASVPATKFQKRRNPIRLPLDFWDLAVDPEGRPVLSWGDGKEDDDLQEVRRLEGDDWRTFYDEAAGGVRKTPLGVGRDGVAWFQSDSLHGPSLIERADLRSGKFTPVLRHERVDPEELILSADGHTLVGAWFHDGKPEPMFIDAEAPEAKLTAAVMAAFPDAWARIVGFSADRAHALISVSSDRDPGRYYLYDSASKKLSFLTEVSPWIDPAKMAPTQRFRFKARDGLELAGLLTLPQTGKAPYPLVVMPHGGPMARDYWEEFDGSVQLLASRGIAVLKVDFRGSSGYGREFERKSWRQWGRAMQDDVTDATRWAIAQGHADAKRTCLYGGSYGAYAAMMGVVREPALYRCAIGVAGVYDLEVMRNWGDVNDSKQGRKYLDDALGSDHSELIRNSPTHRARDIQVPLLFAHGYRDERASPEHFRSMTRALDRAGVRYESFVRADEGHGFFDEKDEVAFAERVLAFLERSWAGAPPADAGAGPGAP